MAAPGWNNVHGFDNGPMPPGFGFPGANPYYQMPGYYPPPQFVPQQMIPPYMMGMVSPSQFPMYAAGAPSPSPFPGMMLKNETGGTGYYGYYYLFPQEHCRIHVFTTKEKPWQIQAYTPTNSNHVKIVVPTSMSVKELMQNLGLKNSQADKNVLYEITEKGNGGWTTGIKMHGGEGDKINKSIGDWGWNKSRSGIHGQKPVVWLWVSDEGA